MENSKISKLSILSIVLVGTVLGTSACSRDEQPPSVSAPATETSEATAEATEDTKKTAEPTPTAEATQEPKEKLVGQEVSNPYGSYVQVELPEDSPAYIVDPKTFKNSIEEGRLLVTDYYSMEEVESAQRFVADFLSTEGINSILNNSTSLPDDEELVVRDQWWEENKVKVSPEFQTEFYNSLSEIEEDKGRFIQLDPWQFERPEYKYVYGENESRIQNLIMKPFEVSSLPSGSSIVIGMKVAYEVPVIIEGKTPAETKELPVPQKVYGTFTYSVIPDGLGGWLFNGYLNDSKTIEAWTNDKGNAPYDSFRKTI